MTIIRRKNLQRQKRNVLLRNNKIVQLIIGLLLTSCVATIFMVFVFMPNPDETGSASELELLKLHNLDQLRHQNHNHNHGHANHDSTDPDNYRNNNDNDKNNNNDNYKDVNVDLDAEEDVDLEALFPFTKDMTDARKKELLDYVTSIRNPLYELHPSLTESDSTSANKLTYDIYNCPTTPPEHYPLEVPIVTILKNWNPDDTMSSFQNPNKNSINSEDESKPPRPKTYTTICRFNYNKPGDILKATNYQKAEVPFIFHNDPAVLTVVEKWNTPGYLSKQLDENSVREDGRYKAEYSETNHLMFYRDTRSRYMDVKPIKSRSESASSRGEEGEGRRHAQQHRQRRKNKALNEEKRDILDHWVKPMEERYVTYDEFVEKASQPIEHMGPTKPHWYFRINAKVPRTDVTYESEDGNMNGNNKNNNKPKKQQFLFNELPFFQSKSNFYIIDENQTRGINCRFGMNGNIAEAHFDGSRNFVMLFGGERRYILSHPKHCPNLGLYESYHPSARHSAINWSTISNSHSENQNMLEDEFPEFKDALGNEIVLQAGDALYLPTQWFHFIMSLNLNWQCNARSGMSFDYHNHIRQCGF